MIENLIAFAMGFALVNLPELMAFPKLQLIETLTITNDVVCIVFTKESMIPKQTYMGEYSRLWAAVKNIMKASPDVDLHYIPEGGDSYNYAIKIENRKTRKMVSFIDLGNDKQSEEPHQHSGIYEIKFTSGKSLVEHGNSEQDIRDFIQRSYVSYGAIETIEEWRG